MNIIGTQWNSTTSLSYLDMPILGVFYLSDNIKLYLEKNIAE
ncbi:MAG: hypothetical protein V1799_07990 [bacterium]